MIFELIDNTELLIIMILVIYIIYDNLRAFFSNKSIREEVGGIQCDLKRLRKSNHKIINLLTVLKLSLKDEEVKEALEEDLKKLKLGNDKEDQKNII